MRQTSSYRLAGNVSVSAAESLLDIRSKKDFGGAAGVVKHGQCAAELFLALLYVVCFFSHAVRISRCLDESGRGFRRQRFVSAERICVRAVCMKKLTCEGRVFVCMFLLEWHILGRDLASGLRGYDVLLIFQQDSSRGLFGRAERQSVQRWVHLLQTKNGAFICVYRSCRLSGIGFTVKGYSTAGWLSTTPCELWSKISSHNALQRACTFIGTHTHVHCFGANSRPPHTPGKEVPD